MTIGEIKKALVELSDFCSRSISCNICPFAERNEYGEFDACRLGRIPCYWHIDDWKEDSNNGSNR